MKKILALILAALMLASFAACSAKDDSKDTDAADTNAEDTNTPADSDSNAADTDAGEGDASVEATPEGVAKGILAKFAEYTGIKEQYDSYVAELGEGEEALSYEDFYMSRMMIAPVEAGAEFVQGFESVPTGFAEGVQFMPGMMGVAFMGFIFRVEDGGDVEAFKTQLNEIANPAWNVCTTADTVICESAGNYVYFHMLVTDLELGGFTEDQVNGFKSVFTSAFGA